MQQGKIKMTPFLASVFKELPNFLLKERVKECEKALINHKRNIEHLDWENQQLMTKKSKIRDGT